MALQRIDWHKVAKEIAADQKKISEIGVSEFNKQRTRKIKNAQSRNVSILQK